MDNNRPVVGNIIRNLVLGGIAAAAVYFSPAIYENWGKAVNSCDESVLTNKLIELIERKDYPAAVKMYSKVSSEGFVTDAGASRYRRVFIEMTKTEKVKDLRKIIASENYSGAMALLKKFKGEIFFSSNELIALEKEAQVIHPSEFLKKAKSEKKPEERLRLYSVANSNFDALKMPNEESKNGVIKSALEIAIAGYDSKMPVQASGDVSKSVNPDKTIFGQFAFVENYIGANNIKSNLDEAFLNEFYTKSESYFRGTLFAASEDNHSLLNDYIARLKAVSDSIGVKDSRARIKPLLESYFNYCWGRIQNKEDYKEADLKHLQTLMQLNKVYSLAKDKEVFSLFLIAGDRMSKKSVPISSGFIDYALAFLESPAYSGGKDPIAQTANSYVKLATSMPAKDRLTHLQTARQLYLRAGIDSKDPRSVGLEALIVKTAAEILGY
jgi:hypothetical protein